MTTKETALQEALNILGAKKLYHCLNLADFNHYWRKHGHRDLNAFHIGCKAAEFMEREGQNRLYEYQEKPTFYNH